MNKMTFETKLSIKYYQAILKKFDIILAFNKKLLI